MNLSPSHTEIATERIATVLVATAKAAERFGADAGLSCRAGCGRCCAAPGVHARVVEMQPAAQKFLRSGEAEAIFAAADASPDGPCVLFQAHVGGGERGACQHYEVRPGVCRLFGYAMTRDKYGEPGIASCPTMRADQPEAFRRADAAMASGALTGPEYRAYDSAVLELADGASELLPINRALMAAITRLAYALSDPSDQ